MGRKNDNTIKRSINIDIREQLEEDVLFLELYDLIATGKKKETIEKALIYYLKNQNKEILEMHYNDKVDDAIRLAKKRPSRAKTKPKKAVKKVETKPKEVKVLEENQTEKEEVVEVKPPIQTIPIEENIEPDVVIKEEKTEVKSDTSDDAIKEDLTTENKVTGSSTTEEKEGDFFKKKKKKKKENEEKDTRTEEQIKAERDAKMAEVLRQAEEADARKEANAKKNIVKWNKD